MERSRTRPIAIVVSILVAVLAISVVTFAAAHVRGVVTGRAADGTLIVRTDDALVAIALNENTRVRQMSGIRQIKVDVASLIPGLRVDVEGTTQSATHFLADRITFTRNDLKIARNAVLSQSGIPSTQMNVPAAMGVSDQVASNSTKQGQAQNRRAVVRVLQNRGITGN